jgi:hypothetical protein
MVLCSCMHAAVLNTCFRAVCSWASGDVDDGMSWPSSDVGYLGQISQLCDCRLRPPPKLPRLQPPIIISSAPSHPCGATWQNDIWIDETTTKLSQASHAKKDVYKSRIQCVDVVSSDNLSRNGKSVTMQDQSQGRTRWVFRLVRALRRVKTLRPVLLYYEM